VTKTFAPFGLTATAFAFAESVTVPMWRRAQISLPDVAVDADAGSSDEISMAHTRAMLARHLVLKRRPYHHDGSRLKAPDPSPGAGRSGSIDLMATA
jgi:hypothetical protein